MTQEAFNALPLLLRRREVVQLLGVKSGGVLLAEGRVRRFWPLGESTDASAPAAPLWNRAADQRSAPRIASGQRAYYLRASVAPLLGLEMDWSEFEQWPATVHRYHLLKAGLGRVDIPRLAESGQMLPLAPRVPCRTSNPIRKHGTPEAWRKCDLAEIVGYEEQVGK